MRPLPHDLDDLRFAPVRLHIEQRLEELGALERGDLRFRLCLDSDLVDWDESHRRDGLLRAIARDLALGGWKLSWDVSGIRVAHGQHSVVLGVPPAVLAYVKEGADVSHR